ncbi:MAG TPA: hypothetical protein VK508_02740 [Cyclobacteriaceae bacterium]|nr:hypothetical protein [Cyclobacteriaceae bacterium]
MNYNWWSWGVLTNGNYAFQPTTDFGGSTGVFIDRTGRMGIGTISPDAMLSVKGKVHAQEVQVDLTGSMAPDYVFMKNYKLPSLETIKAYINQYHHLPEVPSAEEFEKNGMNVGEMNLLLLKKIEELTLHMIELKEEVDALKKQTNK